MIDQKTNKARTAGSTMSLENLLRSFNNSAPTPKVNTADGNWSPVQVQLPNCVLHNAGNDALMTLFALQMLLDRGGTQVPVSKKIRNLHANVNLTMPSPVMTPPTPLTPDATSNIPAIIGSVSLMKARPASAYDLSAEFEQMQLGLGAIARTNSGGPVIANGKSFFPGRRHS